MPERITPPSMADLLSNVESRVLLQLTYRFELDPEELERQALSAIHDEQVPEDVLLPLNSFVIAEQRRVTGRRSHEELQRCIASVVLAHVWQAENNTARQHRKKLPH